jgi:hypothetical protein
VNTSPTRLLVEFEVNLNALVPVLHLGLAATSGLGRANVPVADPEESVVNAAPAELQVGVT